MKILIDSHIPYIGGVLERYAEVGYLHGEQFTNRSVSDCDVLIIRTRTKCDRSLLDGSAVKLIATATIGTDHIDLNYCQSNGIEVASAAGCNAAGVLQWVAATLVEIVGNGEPESHTLGIVGIGNVGSLVKQYAQMWGFNVLCNDIDPTKCSASLDDITRQADIITFHVPLDGSTHGIIDTRIANCGARVINSSRGEIADEQALLRYRTAYCADVWSGEPDINRCLLERALVATPHIAGYSAQGKANAAASALCSIAKKFGFQGLYGWYPSEIEPVSRRAISWTELKETIKKYINVPQLTASLKSTPEQFEALRNDYNYRQEYF